MDREYDKKDESYVKKYSPYINIILIAHVQSPRGYRNTHQIQCDTTERFSVEEFHEIYQGIVSAGFYIQSVYFNELDFIADYVEHPNRFDNCLVYNLARNGLGDNKKTIIPSFCELLGIRYTTSPSLSCALARNKYYFSTLFSTHNVPVPKSWLYNDKGIWINGAPKDGTKVICKPTSESASQGINESKITTVSSKLESKLSGSSYIVQEYIEGFECEVPVFKAGNAIHVLPPIGIDLRGKHILDEEASEHSQYGFYQLAKHFSSDVVTNIQSVAEKAFLLLQMDVYGRIDFRITPDGQAFVFDVSTTPYITRHSSFAYSFKQLGLEYCDIFHAIISAALMREYKTT